MQGVEAADVVRCCGVFAGSSDLYHNHGVVYSPRCVEHSLGGSYFAMEQREHDGVQIAVSSPRWAL
jgi:hypothetical protein